MNIVFINANKDHNTSFFSKIAYTINSSPILTLQYLSAITPKQHTAQVIDDRYDPINYAINADLIGISTVTASAPRAYEIADEFRRRKKTVVFGGFHPTACPTEAKYHADSVVIGEAENIWDTVLQDFQNNKLQPFYHTTKETDIAQLPYPDWKCLRIKPMISAVVTSRGCPYNCSYCTLTHFYGQRYRPRPIPKIIHEMKSSPRKYISLSHDSSLTINPDLAKSLLKAMIPLKKKFIAWGSIPTLMKHKDIIPLSKKAGCVIWSFGFESVNQESVDKDAKKAYNVNQYKEIVREIHNHGMHVYGCFVFGFDHDTPDCFDYTLKAAYDYGIDIAEFDILTPFPITRLFTELNQQKRILSYDWKQYDLHHVVFQPKNMSPKELQNGVNKISTHFYSPLKSLQRMFRCFNRNKRFVHQLFISAINLSMARFHKEYNQIVNNIKR